MGQNFRDLRINDTASNEKPSRKIRGVHGCGLLLVLSVRVAMLHPHSFCHKANYTITTVALKILAASLLIKWMY
jgi:hypothetical protein